MTKVLCRTILSLRDIYRDESIAAEDASKKKFYLTLSNHYNSFYAILKDNGIDRLWARFQYIRKHDKDMAKRAMRELFHTVLLDETASNEEFKLAVGYVEELVL